MNFPHDSWQNVCLKLKIQKNTFMFKKSVSSITKCTTYDHLHCVFTFNINCCFRRSEIIYPNYNVLMLSFTHKLYLKTKRYNQVAIIIWKQWYSFSSPAVSRGLRNQGAIMHANMFQTILYLHTLNTSFLNDLFPIAANYGATHRVHY